MSKKHAEVLQKALQKIKETDELLEGLWLSATFEDSKHQEGRAKDFVTAADKVSAAHTELLAYVNWKKGAFGGQPRI